MWGGGGGGGGGGGYGRVHLRDPKFSKLSSKWRSLPHILPGIFDQYRWKVKNWGASRTDSQGCSKFLWFACENYPIPKWEWLLEKDIMLAYIKKLERHSIGADGQTHELDAIDAAVRYTTGRRNWRMIQGMWCMEKHCELAIPSVHEEWKKQAKVQIVHLEKRSEHKHTPTFDEVNRVVSSKELWWDFWENSLTKDPC